MYSPFNSTLVAVCLPAAAAAQGYKAAQVAGVGICTGLYCLVIPCLGDIIRYGVKSFPDGTDYRKP